MKHALSRESRVPLGEFARSRLLVAFDYDGTLAPLTANRAKAPMRSRTRELLSELSRRYPCVVISGRARDDVVLQLAGVSLHAVAGNHGAELPGLSRDANVDVLEWRERLTESLGGTQGIAVEDKRLSLSVHFRAARDKAAARRAVLAVAETFGAARVIGGKDVVNLVPRGAPHKGFALDELRRSADCEAAIYVGDDETDEDVFSMRRASRLFGVRVGAKKRSEAEYYLKTQGEVDALISTLIELRLDAVVTR